MAAADVLELLEANPGVPILVTGSAGTGKTRVLRAVTDELNSLETEYEVVGSTWLASIRVGVGKPTTIHSWMGLTGLCPDTQPEIVGHVLAHPRGVGLLRRRFKKCQVI